MIADRRLLAALVLIALAACDRGPSSDELARRDRLRAETTDPAVTDALSDPILADRALAVQDGTMRVRATPGPVQVTYPPAADTDRAIMPVLARCDGRIERGEGWAGRLPAAFPLYPGARVVNAGGRDAPSCRVRAVEFSASAPAPQVVSFYEARAVAEGYRLAREQREGETLLSGTGPGAFLLIVRPTKAGMEGGLIINDARAPARP